MVDMQVQALPCTAVAQLQSDISGKPTAAGVRCGTASAQGAPVSGMSASAALAPPIGCSGPPGCCCCGSSSSLTASPAHVRASVSGVVRAWLLSASLADACAGEGR